MTLSEQQAADALAHVREHNPHAGQGSVLLDIGDGVGALVVTMPEAMLGHEVEIESEDPRVTADLVHLYAHDHGDDHGHDHDGAHDHGHDHGHGHGSGHARPHVAVVPRPLPGGGQVACLVFGSLPAGRYTLHEKGSPAVAMTVDVPDGGVLETAWPA